jgi:hypothetical protein
MDLHIGTICIVQKDNTEVAYLIHIESRLITALGSLSKVNLKINRYMDLYIGTICIIGSCFQYECTLKL